MMLVLTQVAARCAGGSQSSVQGAEVLVAMRHGQSLFRYLDDAQPCSITLPACACLGVQRRYERSNLDAIVDFGATDTG